MTNFEAWQLYMRDISSPQSFVDWGYYALISACLQRRVWTGPEHMPLYANQYIILVGDPGTGKGLVVKQLDIFLKHFKLRNPAASIATIDASTADKAASFTEQAENFKLASEGNAKTNIAEPLKIQTAPTATTYEALVEAMAKAVRTKSYQRFCDKQQKMIWDYYRHHSLSFNLEEISSLFRKKTEDVVNLLIVAFDCGDYDYFTKTKGKDQIRNVCLNFFGGTTQAFMKGTFDDKLIGEGFSSRVIFVVDNQPRHMELFVPMLSKEQLEAKQQILTHISKLIDLYGRAELSKEAQDFMSHWYKYEHSKERLSKHEKLKPYDARKGIHALKLAAAIHFGESAEMVIGIESCKKALEALSKIEPNMVQAVSFDSKNPLSNLAQAILKYIKKSGPLSTIDLLEHFFDDENVAGIKETIEFLTDTSKLFLLDTLRDKKTKSKVQCWFTEREVNLDKYNNSPYEKI